MTVPTEWSDLYLSEQAFLVSRGVRPLALVGSVSRDPKVMHECFMRLRESSAKWQGSVFPFIVPRKDSDCAMAGFAAAQWVIDLLRWSYDQPPRQRHQIIGLLLGYAPGAIAEHDVHEFAGNPMVQSRSIPQPAGSKCMA